eukprot:3414570-Pyramimonas_sp.AAC.1
MLLRSCGWTLLMTVEGSMGGDASEHERGADCEAPAASPFGAARAAVSEDELVMQMKFEKFEKLPSGEAH